MNIVAGSEIIAAWLSLILSFMSVCSRQPTSKVVFLVDVLTYHPPLDWYEKSVPGFIFQMRANNKIGLL